jgi:hypothetical protein
VVASVASVVLSRIVHVLAHVRADVNACGNNVCIHCVSSKVANAVPMEFPGSVESSRKRDSAAAGLTEAETEA